MGCHFLLQCMKVKSESEVAQSCPILSDPMDCSLRDSSIHGIFQAKVLEWGATAFSRGSSQPRDRTLQADSLSAEPPEKPKNTGMGSLSLLQWIFPTQELNRGLLHCRQILYQMSCPKMGGNLSIDKNNGCNGLKLSNMFKSVDS